MNSSNTIGLKDNPAWGRAVGGKFEMEARIGGRLRLAASFTGSPVRGFIAGGILFAPGEVEVSATVGTVAIADNGEKVETVSIADESGRT